MDLNKLQQFFINKKHCDIVIHLKDQYQTIKINAHKIILASSSDYFDKMIDFNNRNEINMEVDDAVITKDIITSFYDSNNQLSYNSNNYPEWEYDLIMFKSRNYLCLPNNICQLYDICVPKEGFELLLEVLQIFDLAQYPRLIQVLKKNLPTNYDLTMFSEDLLDEIYSGNYIILIIKNNKSLPGSIIEIRNAKTGTLVKNIDNIIIINQINISHDNSLIATSCNNFITLRNYHTGQLVHGLTCSNGGKIKTIIFSYDDTLLISSNSKEIKIWKLNKELKYEHHKTMFGHDYSVNKIVISKDNTKIASLDDGGKILLWNVVDGSIIKIIETCLMGISFSCDSRYLVYQTYNSLFKLNLNTNQVTTLKCRTVYTHLLFSPNKLLFCAVDNKLLELYDIEFNLINIIETDSKCTVVSIDFSADGTMIATSNHNNEVKIWDVTTGLCINTLTTENGYTGPIIFLH